MSYPMLKRHFKPVRLAGILMCVHSCSRGWPTPSLLPSATVHAAALTSLSLGGHNFILICTEEIVRLSTVTWLKTKKERENYICSLQKCFSRGSLPYQHNWEMFDLSSSKSWGASLIPFENSTEGFHLIFQGSLPFSCNNS